MESKLYLSGVVRCYKHEQTQFLFRCILDGHPILASASSSGHIALWDLDSGGRLLHLIRGAHDGAVSALEWVPGQPVLISSGEDNSVKVVIRTSKSIHH